MPGQFDYGWLGGHQRPLEHQEGVQSVVQMGARVYHPVVGRFLEVDPIEGGVHNDYGYVADPVNTQDVTGKAMGPAQAEWCLAYSEHCKEAWSIKERAEELYEIWNKEFGRNIAGSMKHFYWMARTTKAIGRYAALQLGIAHEKDGGNGVVDTNRDLMNNELGSIYGMLHTSNHDIAMEARRRAANGGLVCKKNRTELGRSWFGQPQVCK